MSAIRIVTLPVLGALLAVSGTALGDIASHAGDPVLAPAAARADMASAGATLSEIGLAQAGPANAATTKPGSRRDRSDAGNTKSASDGSVKVGRVYDLGQIHFITQPGRYGLGEPVSGSRYAVIGNQLVRVDSQTNQVLSVIRIVEDVLD